MGKKDDFKQVNESAVRGKECGKSSSTSCLTKEVVQ
jgi:hypothetical protein